MNAPRQGFPLLAKENKACIHILQVEVREERSPTRDRTNSKASSTLLAFSASSIFPPSSIKRKKKESVGAEMEYVFILQK